MHSVLLVLAVLPLITATVTPTPCGPGDAQCIGPADLYSDGDEVLSLLQTARARIHPHTSDNIPLKPVSTPNGMLGLLEKVTPDGILGLLEKVKGLAETSARGELIADPIMQEVLRNIVQQMQDNVINVTQVNHNEDQREVSREHATIGNCSTVKDAAFTTPGGINALKTIQETAHATHIKCRSLQKTKNEMNETLCSDFVFYANGLSAPSCLYPSLPIGSPPSMINCLAQTVTWGTRANSTYVTKWDKCTAASADLTSQTTTCNSNQATFESNFCSYGQLLTTTCSTYETCHNSQSSSYNSAIADVKVSEAARKAEFQAAKKVICYAGVLNATDSSKASTLAACNSAAYTTTHLDIIYPSVPSATVCDASPVDDKPCNSNFLSTYYLGKTWSTRAPAAACSPCAWAVAAASTPAATASVPVAEEICAATNFAEWDQLHEILQLHGDESWRRVKRMRTDFFNSKTLTDAQNDRVGMPCEHLTNVYRSVPIDKTQVEVFRSRILEAWEEIMEELKSPSSSNLKAAKAAKAARAAKAAKAAKDTTPAATPAAAASTPAATASPNLNGEQACENHGFNEEQCSQVGCCFLDGLGECKSSVGRSSCSAESRQATAHLTGIQACENHGFNEEQCLQVGCCGFWDGQCESEVPVGDSCGGPAAAAALRDRKEQEAAEKKRTQKKRM